MVALFCPDVVRDCREIGELCSECLSFDRAGTGKLGGSVRLSVGLYSRIGVAMWGSVDCGFRNGLPFCSGLLEGK